MLRIEVGFPPSALSTSWQQRILVRRSRLRNACKGELRCF
jgi:hypothetical protein